MPQTSQWRQSRAPERRFPGRLTFTEQNMKAAFDHARKLVHATDLQQAMQIQSEFLKSQFTNAGEHMRQITGGVMSAAKDASKRQS
jgi:hypothetical protein